MADSLATLLSRFQVLVGYESPVVALAESLSIAAVDEAIGSAAPNLAPNSDWYVCHTLTSSPRMNEFGTGSISPVSVSSYSTGSNTVVCQCADTSSLSVGMIGTFSAAAHANMKIASCRILSIVANTSFTVKLQLNHTGQASAACTFHPIMAGGANSVGTGDGLDGWSKTTTLQAWREEFAVNRRAGSKYSCGAKKGSAAMEALFVTVPANSVYRLQGKKFSFGAWVYQKIRSSSASGTWRTYITTNGAGGTTTESASGTSGAYAFGKASVTVPEDATSISYGVRFLGSLSDVYYVSCPKAVASSRLEASSYSPSASDYLVPRVKMSPLSWFGAAVAFPATVDGGGVTYGFQLDVYAETNGAIAPGCRYLNMQIEARGDAPVPVAGGGAVGGSISLRNQELVPHIYANVNHIQSAGGMIGGQGSLVTLKEDGTLWVYTGTASTSFYAASVDINGVGLP